MRFGLDLLKTADAAYKRTKAKIATMTTIMTTLASEQQQSKIEPEGNSRR
jgi:hypothetical protein